MTRQRTAPSRSDLAPERKSGFVRDMSLGKVVAFNVAGFSLGLALISNPPFISGFAPAADFRLVVLLGALIAVLNGFVYSGFAAVFDRSGGEWVYISRSLTPWVAFLASWGFTWTQALGLAYNVGFTANLSIGPALVDLHQILPSGALELGQLLQTPRGALWLGAVQIVLVGLALRLTTQALSRIVFWLSVVGLLGPCLIAFAFYSHNHDQFVALWNNLNPAAGYDQVIAAARSVGVAAPTTTSLGASLRAAPIGFLMFLGFSYSVYLGSEVRSPSKTQGYGIALALLIGVGFFVLVLGRYQHVLGNGFLVAANNPQVLSALGMETAPGVTLLAASLLDSVALRIVMHVGIAMWFLAIPLVIAQVITRNMIAWSIDYLGPDTWTGAGQRASWSAILTMLFVAVVFLLVTWSYGVSLVAATASVSIAYFLTAVAAIVFPFRRADLFAVAPAFARRTWYGIPVLSVVGLLSAASFCFVGWISFTSPMIVGLTDHRAIAIVAGLYLVGVAWYGVFFYRYRGRLARLGLAPISRLPGA